MIYLNRFEARILGYYLDAQWQHIEQMHLSRSQVGLIKDIRQIEMFRDYLETLC